MIVVSLGYIYGEDVRVLVKHFVLNFIKYYHLVEPIPIIYLLLLCFNGSTPTPLFLNFWHKKYPLNWLTHEWFNGLTDDLGGSLSFIKLYDFGLRANSRLTRSVRFLFWLNWNKNPKPLILYHTLSLQPNKAFYPISNITQSMQSEKSQKLFPTLRSQALRLHRLTKALKKMDPSKSQPNSKNPTIASNTILVNDNIVLI